MPVEPAPRGVLSLHADCVPVRGAHTSAIYDLNRLRIATFPTAYFDVIRAIDGAYADDPYAPGDDPHADKIASLVRYLLENEMAAFQSEPARFPPIDTGWDVPGQLQNAIIDIGNHLHDFEGLFAQLDELGCQFVQIRAYACLPTLEDIAGIARAARHKSLRGIELFLHHDPRFDADALRQLVRDHLIIARLVFHSAPEDVALEVAFGGDTTDGVAETRRVHFTCVQLISSDDCGRITAAAIQPPTVEMFNELRQFNGCLNGKISIDVNGQIRNCPSMSTSFGDAATRPLRDVVSDAAFREVWDIGKDRIDICRDCELRYACTDCRAFLQRSDDLYSKPAKCGYDPYTGKWDLRVDDTAAQTPSYTRSAPLAE